MFSQRPSIDFDETYSLVMDTITIKYLISLAISKKKKLEMHLIDAIIAHLYGTLDTNIFMKLLEGFKLLEKK